MGKIKDAVRNGVIEVAGRETVTSILNDVRDEICENYCKYTLIYSGDEDIKALDFEGLLDEKCKSCPLNRL